MILILLYYISLLFPFENNNNTILCIHCDVIIKINGKSSVWKFINKYGKLENRNIVKKRCFDIKFGKFLTLMYDFIQQNRSILL